MKMIILTFSLSILSSPLLAEMILPDEYYIEKECLKSNSFIKRLSNPNYRLPLSPSRDRLTELSNDVEEICLAVKAKKLSASDWFRRMELISSELQNALRCTDCLGSLTVVNSKELIPEGFSTYILALIPSPELVDDNLEWQEFRNIFYKMGNSIGEAKAAIWMGTDYSETDPLKSGVDIQRSKYYCDLYSLDYNNGPYLLVTSKRPDLVTTDDEVVFLKFNNISKDRIIRVMNVLEQNLRTELIIRKRSLILEEIKQRMLSVKDDFRDDLRNIVISWFKK